MALRDIDEPTKRAIRQKCGFGCVICGMPIYDYDHIEQHAIVQEHDPANIVLLCPAHHAEKTRGRMDTEVVRKAAVTPFNRARDHSSPYGRLMVGKGGELQIGGNQYEFDFGDLPKGRFDAIRLGGQSVVGLSSEDGVLSLDVLMTAPDGGIILKIDQGQMTVARGVWDFSIEGPTVKIREKLRRIWLEMEFMRNGLKILRGRFVRPPYDLAITPDAQVLLIGGQSQISMKGCRIRGCKVGVEA